MGLTLAFIRSIHNSAYYGYDPIDPTGKQSAGCQVARRFLCPKLQTKHFSHLSHSLGGGPTHVTMRCLLSHLLGSGRSTRVLRRTHGKQAADLQVTMPLTLFGPTRICSAKSLNSIQVTKTSISSICGSKTVCPNCRLTSSYPGNQRSQS